MDGRKKAGPRWSAFLVLGLLFFLPTLAPVQGQNLGKGSFNKLLVPQPAFLLENPGAVVPGKPFLIRAKVTLPPGYYQDRHSDFFHFQAEAPFKVERWETSPPVLRDGKESLTGTFSAELTLVLDPRFPPGPPQGKIRLGYQICQIDGVCLLPAETTADFSFTINQGAGPAPHFFDLTVNLIFAFIGGILLNFMPCVFPVLSLKALQAGRAGLDFPRFRKTSWAFVLGILSFFFALGLFIFGLRMAGGAPSWGFFFQEPLFVWGLTVLFWLGALVLWGFLPLSGFYWNPKAVKTGQEPGKSKFPWGSFLAGGLEVLAAAPCTAPLLGPALGYAFALPSFLLLPFFLAVGLGLALPHGLLACFPSWGRLLPKPGPWVENFEKVMGFLLAATVIYLLTILQAQLGTQVIFPSLVLFLLLAFLFWLGKQRKKRGIALTLIALGITVLGTLWTFQSGPARPLGLSSGVAQEKIPGSGGWVAFSQDQLTKETLGEHPVFIDATAAWCATCQVNETLVLSRTDVREAFEKNKIVKMRADFTRPDPEIAAWLESVGRAGLPVYALYRPGQPVQILPEILDAGALIRLLNTTAP